MAASTLALSHRLLSLVATRPLGRLVLVRATPRERHSIDRVGSSDRPHVIHALDACSSLEGVLSDCGSAHYDAMLTSCVVVARQLWRLLAQGHEGDTVGLQDRVRC